MSIENPDDRFKVKQDCAELNEMIGQNVSGVVDIAYKRGHKRGSTETTTKTNIDQASEIKKLGTSVGDLEERNQNQRETMMQLREKLETEEANGVFQKNIIAKQNTNMDEFKNIITSMKVTIDAQRQAISVNESAIEALNNQLEEVRDSHQTSAEFQTKYELLLEVVHSMVGLKRVKETI